MKINPINNFQFNRNQKVQAKNNPIFEGVRFVPDRAFAEKYLSSTSNNGQLSSKSLENIAAKFKNISDYANKKILPMVLAEKIMPYVNNNTVFPDNVKNIEDLAKVLWPEDTDVKINCEIEETYWPRHFTTIKFFDCINGNNPLIKTTFKDFYRFENNISGLNNILTIFEGAISKNSHEFSIYSTRLDDWLSMLHGLNENFHTNNLENLLSTLIEHQPEFKSFFKQLEDTAKLATQSNLENLENSIKNCEQKEIDSNNTKDIESKSLSGIKPTPLLAEGSALKAWLDGYEKYLNSEIKDIISKVKNDKMSPFTANNLHTKLIKGETGDSIDSFPLIKEAKRVIENAEKCRMVPNSSSEDTLKIYPIPSPSQVIQVQPIVTQVERPSKSNITNTLETIDSEQDSGSLLYLLGVIPFFIGAILDACSSDKQIIQDKDVNNTEIVTKTTEDARMQKGDINYEEEMEYARREMESRRQRAEQQMEQARREMEELRGYFRF